MLADELARANPDNRLFAMRVLPILIEMQISAGDLGAADRSLGELEKLTDSSDYRAGKAAVAQARALIYAARGDTSAAETALRDAHAEWQTLGLPYEAARAALLLSRVLADAQAKPEAVEFASEAVQTFSELHAKLDLAQAESVLRQIGVRSRVRRSAPKLPPPLNELTAREAEVLTELTRGRTNKQIAKTLSMSPKTVGNHVSSILTKLGCATRTEAAQLCASLSARSV
jgi:DNA-binding NarL/FixJ family response regulator